MTIDTEAAILAEREACARLAEQVLECWYRHDDDCGCPWIGIRDYIREIPRLIRERK